MSVAATRISADSSTANELDTASGRSRLSVVEQGSAARDADQGEALFQRLQQLAVGDPEAFDAALQDAFGGRADSKTLDALGESIRAGEFESPRLQFVDAGTLPEGAWGAYSSKDGGTIYLDRRLLSDPSKLESVYTEELGHHLDAQLGAGDAAGDEGAIFARTLLDGPLESRTLQTLRAEDDSGVLRLSDLDIEVEFNQGGTEGGGETGGTDDNSTSSGPDDGTRGGQSETGNTNDGPSNANDNTADGPNGGDPEASATTTAPGTGDPTSGGPGDAGESDDGEEGDTGPASANDDHNSETHHDEGKRGGGTGDRGDTGGGLEGAGDQGDTGGAGDPEGDGTADGDGSGEGAGDGPEGDTGPGGPRNGDRDGDDDGQGEDTDADGAAGDGDPVEGAIADPRSKGLDGDGESEDEAEDRGTEEEGGGWYSTFSSWGHGLLDAAGFVPGLGAAPDLVNAGWHALEGNKERAAESAMAAIPFGGDVAKAGAIGYRAANRAGSAEKRAQQVHSLLDSRAQRARTTAVTETEEGVRVVSSSERRLSPAQRSSLKENEVEGVGTGHAEVTGINSARERGLTPTGTAASRPICSDCASTLERENVTPLSPLK